MIRVTKLNGEVFYVNPYEIEFLEETPDTVISLKTGKKVLVAEKADTIISEMIEFYRQTVPLTRPFDPESTPGEYVDGDEDDDIDE